MSVDGVLLHRVTSIMNHDVPLKINKITQPSQHEFIIHCFAGKKKNLFISTHPKFSRIQWTTDKPSSNIDNTHLLTLMRKHLDGGIITKIEQFGFDRVMTLHIEHRDDMGVIRPYRLIVELLGKYANVIIVDDNNTIVDALKRISPFENNDRAIVSGSLYEYPPQFDKKSFLELPHYTQESSLRNQFNGISPILEKEIMHRLEMGQDPQAIVNEALQSDTLYVYGDVFHIIELKHRNATPTTYAIMEGLDAFFVELQVQERIKNHTGDLLKLIRRELKRSNLKLPKLYDDYDKAHDSDDLRLKGDLLFAFASNLPNGNSEITLQDFEGKPITIQLDPRFSGKDNAKRYFKQYQKKKTSIQYLEEQIARTERRIEYFTALETQALQATVEDAQEIKDELLALGIVRQRKSKAKHPLKKKKPNYLVINYDDDTLIYVGKNNLQNDYITFKLGRKEDTWFHAANTFGAHVLIKTPELDEPKIRLCAHLAAYFSKSRLGSSVEVYYTQIKNIKKIPGETPGKVSLATHKSIFIDPEESIVTSYLNQ